MTKKDDPKDYEGFLHWLQRKCRPLPKEPPEPPPVEMHSTTEMTDAEADAWFMGLPPEE